MTLEQIVEMAIPISQRECYMNRAKKEWMRKQAIERLMQWKDEEVKKTFKYREDPAKYYEET